MAKEKTDKYANLMIGDITESAANTLTFEQLPQITSLLEKKAFLVNKILWEPTSATWNELKADAELVYYGISLSDRWTSLQLSEPSIIDLNEIRTMTQTAVGFNHTVMPFVKDYSTLPGGGILIPARPIFLFCKGSGLAAATGFYCRIYFTIVDLVPADFWDLVESLQAYT